MSVDKQLQKLLLDNMDSPQDLFTLMHDMAVNLSKLLVICERYAPPGTDKAYMQVLKGVEQTVEHHLACKSHVH